MKYFPTAHVVSKETYYAHMPRNDMFSRYNIA